MSNFQDDPVILKLDAEITRLEQEVESLTQGFSREIMPKKEQVSFLSDVRRRLSGLTQAPTRADNQEKSSREVALEEEVFRLREELKTRTDEKRFDY